MKNSFRNRWRKPLHVFFFYRSFQENARKKAWVLFLSILLSPRTSANLFVSSVFLLESSTNLPSMKISVWQRNMTPQLLLLSKEFLNRFRPMETRWNILHWIPKGLSGKKKSNSLFIFFWVNKASVSILSELKFGFDLRSFYHENLTHTHTHTHMHTGTHKHEYLWYWWSPQH